MKDKSLPSSKLPDTMPTEDLSGAEKLVDSLRPYGSMIALGIALLFLVFVAATWLIKSNLDYKEDQWRLLNSKIAEFGLTENTSGLKEVAEEFPEGKAGLWGLQLAGDIDLRNGIAQLGVDREAGLKQIEKAREALQKIVDSPATLKSSMLQRRSTFSLAYAEESLGNFSKAKEHYQQIAEGPADASFAEAAKRGLERTSDPAFVALYETFKNWEDPLAEAPGPVVPDRPDISFPEIDLPAADGQDNSKTEKKESEAPAASSEKLTAPAASASEGEKSDAKPDDSTTPTKEDK